jgi:hypothetical protein
MNGTTRWMATATLAATLLAGCGSSDDTASAGETAQQASLAPNASSAPDCPAGAAASGKPGDILGIYPGQGVDAAEAIVRCRENLIDVGFGEDFFPLPSTEPPLRETLIATSGTPCTFDAQEFLSRGTNCGSAGFEGSQTMTDRDEKLLIALVGAANAERVAGVWRSKEYAEGKRPVLADTADSLRAKYGPPSEETERRGELRMIWIHDVNGRPMSRENPVFRTCRSIDADQTGRQAWSEGCGLTIVAKLEAARENPSLVAELHVAATDQAATIAGLRDMAATIRQNEETERASEVDAARREAGEVEL